MRIETVILGWLDKAVNQNANIRFFVCFFL